MIQELRQDPGSLSKYTLSLSQHKVHPRNLIKNLQQPSGLYCSRETHIHHVSEKNNRLCCWAGAGYYLVKHCPILRIILGRHIPKGCWLKTVLSIPNSPYFCFYTTWGNKHCKFDAFSCFFSENSFINMTRLL